MKTTETKYFIELDLLNGEHVNMFFETLDEMLWIMRIIVLTNKEELYKVEDFGEAYKI